MTELFSGIDAGWLYSAFAFIALGSTVVIILVILSENRNPVKSLAWVTVLLLLPVVGLILYLFFGRNFKNKRLISRRSRRRLRRQEPRVASDPRSQNLDERSVQNITIARTLIGAQFYTSTRQRPLQTELTNSALSSRSASSTEFDQYPVLYL